MCAFVSVVCSQVNACNGKELYWEGFEELSLCILTAFDLTRWFPALSVVPCVRADCALVTPVEFLWSATGATSLRSFMMPQLQAAGIEGQGVNASGFEPYLEVKVSTAIEDGCVQEWPVCLMPPPFVNEWSCLCAKPVVPRGRCDRRASLFPVARYGTGLIGSVFNKRASVQPVDIGLVVRPTRHAAVYIQASAPASCPADKNKTRWL